jgi:glucose 1-dehydrogenase
MAAMTAPNFSLHGKVALITGAGRGIGLGIARALASAGCAVAIQDLDRDVALLEVDRIHKEGGRGLALSGDISDLNLPQQLIDQTTHHLGGLHILINNAALQSTRHWLENTPDEIEHQWRANLISPILLCQLAVPLFKRQRWGRILNIGSIQQLAGNPTMMPYAMSKSALENMTKGLARDLAKDDITVNLIAPGYFNTWRNRDHLRTQKEIDQRGRDYVPMERIGEPEDIGGLALMLCSEAGSYITGQNIHCDGGMSVRFKQ